MTAEKDPGIHIYGPVPSRRLGYSLGIDLLPFKTCSMDCVYCQLGSSGRTTIRRRDYIPVRAVLSQVRRALAAGTRIDALTFSGSGEPVLHAGIGRAIAGIKRMTAAPVVVLTNSSCLTGRQARRDLLQADIVVPSLDAASERVFARINRPHAGLTAARIIRGLVEFRREFRGRIWLEVMLVKGVNDGPAHLRALKEAIGRIRPDRIQLNTVVRPPAEPSVRPLSPREMEKVRGFLGGTAEIIAHFGRRPRSGGAGDASAAILESLRRRPMTAAELRRALGFPAEEVMARLRRLVVMGAVRAVGHGGAEYFEAAAG